jgi:hypothetical protein
MNWLRLLEIIEMARSMTGRIPKRDMGWNWQCYCRVCCALRAAEDPRDA